MENTNNVAEINEELTKLESECADIIARVHKIKTILARVKEQIK